MTYLPALNLVPPLMGILFFFAACAAGASATEAAMAMPATMSRLVMCPPCSSGASCDRSIATRTYARAFPDASSFRTIFRGPSRRIRPVPSPAMALLADLTTLRLGGPPRRLVERRDRGRARRRRPRGRRRRRAAARARRRQQPRGRRRRLPRHRRADRDPGVGVARTPAAARRHRGRGGRAVGRRSSPARRRAAGSGSRRCPASPARSARRRSRTSAPTARRSPTRSPRCAPGTASTGARAHLRRRRLRLRLPHQPRSSATPAATSCSR